MKKKLVIGLLIVSTMVTTVSGCRKAQNVEDMPLMPAATKQEVLDYYANAMKYDAVITRASDTDKHETVYEEYDVTGDKEKKLEELYKQAEGVLSSNVYDSSKKEVVAEDVYNYVKAELNDLSLDNGKIDSVTGALGYYFVNVSYDTSAIESGTFNSIASLVGVDGAFVENNVSKVVEKNDEFLNSAVDKINKYFILNGINENVTYSDEDTYVFSSGVADASQYFNDESVDELNSKTNEDNATEDDAEETEDNTEADANGTEDGKSSEKNTEEDSEVTDDESSEDIVDSDLAGNSSVDSSKDDSSDEDLDTDLDEDLADGPKDVSTGVESDRKVKFDIKYFNKLMGSSASSLADMPELSMVYNIPESSGTVSGMGIYPSGNDGLKSFGYDRSKTNGTITLRYVFKDSDDGSGNIVGKNIYILNYENQNSITGAESEVNVPDYLMQEFDNLIDRVDRMIVGCNLSGMISDTVFNDLGFGILRGYLSNGADISRCVSEVKQVVNRDVENNKYVLEVDTTIKEGARSANAYGTYIDKSYVTVEQNGTDFQITDWVRMSRKTSEEPDIDVDSSTLKRLIALNLTGEVSDDTKKNVNELLSDLYKASTLRVLNGPHDTEDSDGNKVTVEKGMYDCYEKDTSLVSSEKVETMNARLRAKLVAHGSDVGSEYLGKVTEWIGGADNQVEFTTEELIKYSDDDTGMYMKVYYLASCINDVWYIDEQKVLDYEDTNVSDTKSYYERLK